ncbi:MAG: esterase-like activity of phytase family protein [Gammaproteobacteria bacterium]|nr:esterase-like activity of phytase family protein [Gammaproteobacteria bacterium]
MNRGANARGLRLALVTVLMLMSAGVRSESIDISRAFSMSSDYTTGDTFMQIRLRGTVELIPAALNGIELHELSGLAWAADEKTLYAVSDAGFVAHLRPHFHDGNLIRVYLDAIHPLLGPDGTPVAKRLADAEGLVARNARNGIRDDTELIISFEMAPRIVHYTPRGEYLRETALPLPLREPDRYSARNRELEALTEHDEFGLITGPERPLKNAHQSMITLYSVAGHSWLYRPIDPEHSALVGLESMPGGDLLILERRFASVFRPVIISLRRMRLHPPAFADETPITDIARFDSSRGWAIDNFEGVARHEGSRYFIVSDDNDSPLQKTLLMYFEIGDNVAPFREADRLSGEADDGSSWSHAPW